MADEHKAAAQYCGIWWNNAVQYYRVHTGCEINNKIEYLPVGYFDCPHEAALAYNLAVVAFFPDREDNGRRWLNDLPQFAFERDVARVQVVKAELAEIPFEALLYTPDCDRSAVQALRARWRNTLWELMQTHYGCTSRRSRQDISHGTLTSGQRLPVQKKYPQPKALRAEQRVCPKFLGKIAFSEGGYMATVQVNEAERLAIGPLLTAAQPNKAQIMAAIIHDIVALAMNMDTPDAALCFSRNQLPLLLPALAMLQRACPELNHAYLTDGEEDVGSLSEALLACAKEVAPAKAAAAVHVVAEADTPSPQRKAA